MNLNLATINPFTLWVTRETYVQLVHLVSLLDSSHHLVGEVSKFPEAVLGLQVSFGTHTI